ncbi:ketoacyl-ACP synthase III [Pontibacter sp. G13]|uniref:3-oxoacyl-ACP synthase III family protein n=1 Tax=Pontibacter sp. G13 TaxID=3074898 RepID=UPI00288BF63E|nr:ketoacyl-ACP synthase III [Pontibacter sp. G13]WNJ19881.1 ketoacyl-ACP synthase III [Pontibacter sp. G13]
MRNAVIRSSGAYLPKRRLTNAYFDETLGENVSEWLETNLEIYERRWCAPEESAVDLAEHASLQALERAGLEAKDLDLIIVATDTPEYLTPATAAVLQYRLQAGHAGSFDLNAACAGFVMGLDVGAKYIRTDQRYKHVLVVGVYAISKFLDPLHKKTATLFADGAGAIILSAEETEDRGYLDSELITLGQYFDGMGIYGVGTKNPLTPEAVANKEHVLKTNYRFPPTLNPQMWTTISRNMLKRLELKPADIDQYFLTQININSIRKTLDNLKLPHEKAHTAMRNYAYTGSACIPIAFNDAWEKGKLTPNSYVFFIGSGSGLTFAGTAFKL